MEFSKLVTARRSVRRYLPDPVPDEALEKIAEALRWAPSWANVQPVRLVAASDEKVKAALQAAVPTSNPAYKALGSAPVILVFAARKGSSGFYKGAQSNRLGDYFMFDSGLAVQNAILAAADQGLGTCLVGIFDVDAIKKATGLPDEFDPIVLSPLGTPETEPNPPARLSTDEILRRNKY